MEQSSEKEYTEGWKYVTDIKAGDQVQWWTVFVKVTAVRVVGNLVYIKVIDNMDGQEKEFSYSVHEELFVRV